MALWRGKKALHGESRCLPMGRYVGNALHGGLLDIG